jgi:hypothetical protein
MNRSWPAALGLFTACTCAGPLDSLAVPGDLTAGQLVPASLGEVTDVTFGAGLSSQATAGDVVVVAKEKAPAGAITSALAEDGVTLAGAFPALGLFLFHTAPGMEASFVAKAAADSNVAVATVNALGLGAQDACANQPAQIRWATALERSFFRCGTFYDDKRNVQVITIDTFGNCAAASHGQGVANLLCNAACTDRPGGACGIDVDWGTPAHCGQFSLYDVTSALAAALNQAVVNGWRQPPVFTVINVSLQFLKNDSKGRVDPVVTKALEASLLESIALLAAAAAKQTDQFDIVVALGNGSGLDLTDVLNGLPAGGRTHLTPVAAVDAAGHLVGNSSDGALAFHAPGVPRPGCVPGDAAGTSTAAAYMTSLIAQGVSLAMDAGVPAPPGFEVNDDLGPPLPTPDKLAALLVAGSGANGGTGGGSGDGGGSTGCAGFFGSENVCTDFGTSCSCANAPTNVCITPALFQQNGCPVVTQCTPAAASIDCYDPSSGCPHPCCPGLTCVRACSAGGCSGEPAGCQGSTCIAL